MKKIKMFLCTFLSAFTMIVSTAFAGDEIINKNVEEVFELYNKKAKEVVFIDVREPFELKEGVIPNVKAIPLGTISSSVAKLDKNKNYVLVCRSGRRSKNAYKIMEKAGFKHLINLEGGMNAWYDKGYPVKK